MFTCSTSGTTYDCKTDLCLSFLLAVFYFLHRGKTDKQPAGTIKLDVTCKCVIILNENAVMMLSTTCLHVQIVCVKWRLALSHILTVSLLVQSSMMEQQELFLSAVVSVTIIMFA